MKIRHVLFIFNGEGSAKRATRNTLLVMLVAVFLSLALAGAGLANDVAVRYSVLESNTEGSVTKGAMRVEAQNLRAGGQPVPPAPPAAFEVLFDGKSDLLSIKAKQAPIIALVNEIARQTRISIECSQELLKEPISADIRHLPLPRAIEEILKGYNYIFVAGFPSGQPGKVSAWRLAKVFILSRKALTPSETSVGNAAGSGLGSLPGPPSSASGHQAALATALKANNPLKAKEIVAALMESGNEEEIRAAAGIFEEVLNSPDYRASYGAVDIAVDALKALSPDRALDALWNKLFASDRQTRMIAANGLGRLGDERAITPLVSVLTDDDPVTGQAAASSLAQMGGKQAADALLQAYQTGSNAVKSAVATAIASHGDAGSQKALAAVTGGAPVPPSPPVNIGQGVDTQ